MDKRLIPKPAASLPELVTGAKEKSYFEWFRCRTAPKLPGSFDSSFWKTVLLQAAQQEPAIFHAVLALGAVQKTGIVSTTGAGQFNDIPDEVEQFALQHYTKAIRQLKRHFHTKTNGSLRITLIACVVFISLELLRGHFETAQTHLQNGLEILKQIQLHSNSDEAILLLGTCQESTNESILEAFSRLQSHVEFFRLSYAHPCLVLELDTPKPSFTAFRTYKDSWRYLDPLFRELFRMSHQARQQATPGAKASPRPLELVGQQHRIRIELSRWLTMHEVLKRGYHGQASADEEKVMDLLCAYHTMATIMVETCLEPDDEMIFDMHTGKFLLLIRHLIEVRTPAAAVPIHELPEYRLDMARSVVDVGWIPALYYAAIKCRVHEVRWLAITMLESASHREGIWDSRITAYAARKVVQLEERDFYGDDKANDFSPIDCPSVEDLSLPVLPETYRMREVEMVLSGSPVDRILLFCKRVGEGEDCRILMSEYNFREQRWSDAKQEACI